MLTTLAAWQRASLRPWLTLGRSACAALEPAGLLTALADLALLNLATGEAREQDLAAAVARDAARPLRSEVVLDHPFAVVRALRPADGRARRRILLAAPYSGYATTVLSGLVVAVELGHPHERLRVIDVAGRRPVRRAPDLVAHRIELRPLPGDVLRRPARPAILLQPQPASSRTSPASTTAAIRPLPWRVIGHLP